MTSDFILSAQAVVFKLWMKTDEVSFSLHLSISVVFVFPIENDDFKYQCTSQYGSF